jgi:hypothetical protein
MHRLESERRAAGSHVNARLFVFPLDPNYEGKR